MEIVIQILKDFGVGFLGAAFFTIFRLGPKFKEEGVDWTRLIGENKMFWIWCTVILFMVSILANIANEKELEAIQYLTGFVLDGNNLGFILLGMGISKGSEEVAGKKLNEKGTVLVEDES